MGGLRPTLHSDWNVIAIGPLRMVENAVTRTMHHGGDVTLRRKHPSKSDFPSENATA